MVSRPAGEVSGEIALAEAGGGNGPHPVAPDKLRQEVWGGVGEESFLPTLMHLVLFSHPLARQPQGVPPPHTQGKQGGWVMWRGVSFREGAMMMMMMGRRKITTVTA